MVKKQKKKSDKRKVKKDRKKPAGKQNWEMNLLVCLLSNGYPMTASQMQGELGIKQPIAFKILKKLKEDELVKVYEKKELGPKRVYFAPTIGCLYYTAMLEYSLIQGKTVDERIERTGTFMRFGKIISLWRDNPIFEESLSTIIDVDSLSNESISDEILEAMKEYGKAYIRYQEAFEEEKNELPDHLKNLIGAAIVTRRDPETQRRINKLLYKHIITFRDEADSFTTRAKELSEEFTD